jgi:hypothetical protein
LKIKEQETRLNRHENDNDDDDKDEREKKKKKIDVIYFKKLRNSNKYMTRKGKVVCLFNEKRTLYQVLKTLSIFNRKLKEIILEINK